MNNSVLKYLNRYYSNDVSYIALMSGAFFPVIQHYDWERKNKIDSLVADMMKLTGENNE